MEEDFVFQNFDKLKNFTIFNPHNNFQKIKEKFRERPKSQLKLRKRYSMKSMKSQKVKNKNKKKKISSEKISDPTILLDIKNNSIIVE